MSTNIVLAGVGGQGTVLASRLISDAAMGKGLAVKAAETIGMAQRGGSVMSHVRIGDDVHAPLVGEGRADLLIAFEPAEAARRLVYLKEGATAIVADLPVVPVSALTGGPAYQKEEIFSFLEKKLSKGQLVVVDAEAAARDLGSAKCLNVVLLGAAVRSGALGLAEEDLEAAIRRRVPERFLELNLKALAYTATH